MSSLGNQYTGSVYWFFLVLRNTGSRGAEVLDLSRWEYEEETAQVILRPKKRGDIRTFDSSIFPVGYLNLIKQGQQNLGIRSLESYRDIFKRHRPYPLFISATKEITLHLPRHEYIRNLYRENYSINQIMLKMGWRSEETVHWYLSAKITDELIEG